MNALEAAAASVYPRQRRSAFVRSYVSMSVSRSRVRPGQPLSGTSSSPCKFPQMKAAYPTLQLQTAGLEVECPPFSPMQSNTCPVQSLPPLAIPLHHPACCCPCCENDT